MRLASRSQLDFPIGYHPSLDGLRGAMTVGVLVFHAFPGWLPGAEILMDIFFVMSGYLITALLMREIDRTGSFSIIHFYKRRAMRLLPALTLMLAAYLVAAALLLNDFRGHLRGAAIALVYYSNWYILSAGHMTKLRIFLGHTWSLSVEEQFYLTWPLLLGFLLYCCGLRRRLLIMTGALALSFYVWRIYLCTHSPSFWRLYLGTDMRAGSLLFGCCIGIGLALPRVGLRLLHNRLLLLSGVPVTIAAIFGLFKVHFFDLRELLYSSLITPPAAMVLILVLIAPRRTLIRAVFEHPIPVFLGRICYGLYLWHIPIFVIMRIRFHAPPGQILWLGSALTVATATLSYYCLELPVLRWRDRLSGGAVREGIGSPEVT